jgi:transcriptional regulator with XRE-family HTH domain
MQKNMVLEERRKKVSPEIRQFVNKSFDVADRICEILKEQGKDQKTLARSLGKSEAEISKWMRGTHNFTLKTLAKIEIVLGVSLIEVSKKHNKTITPQAMAKHFPKLSSKSTVYPA